MNNNRLLPLLKTGNRTKLQNHAFSERITRQKSKFHNWVWFYLRKEKEKTTTTTKLCEDPSVTVLFMIKK